MNKKVAIMQSNYIPWKGYFDLINMVDEFILYDDVQYNRRNWRNRNQIKTPDGVKWVTIPVNVKGKFHQKINEVTAVNNHWRKKHWRTIQFAYKNALFFDEYEAFFENLFLDSSIRNLSEINRKFIAAICSLLGIKTKTSTTKIYDCESSSDKVVSIIELLKRANASTFLNGPVAKQYMHEDMFMPYGIQLLWMDYFGYPEYNQLFGKFDHYVSIIDLIFNMGPHATEYIKSFI